VVHCPFTAINALNTGFVDEESLAILLCGRKKERKYDGFIFKIFFHRF
jgi:hypothetical protein